MASPVDDRAGAQLLPPVRGEQGDAVEPALCPMHLDAGGV